MRCTLVGAPLRCTHSEGCTLVGAPLRCTHSEGCTLVEQKQQLPRASLSKEKYTRQPQTKAAPSPKPSPMASAADEAEPPLEAASETLLLRPAQNVWGISTTLHESPLVGVTLQTVAPAHDGLAGQVHGKEVGALSLVSRHSIPGGHCATDRRCSSANSLPRPPAPTHMGKLLNWICAATVAC